MALIYFSSRKQSQIKGGRAKRSLGGAERSAPDKRESFAAFLVSVLISRQSKPALIYLQSSSLCLRVGWQGGSSQTSALFADRLISHQALPTCASVVFSAPPFFSSARLPSGFEGPLISGLSCLHFLLRPQELLAALLTNPVSAGEVPRDPARCLSLSPCFYVSRTGFKSSCHTRVVGCTFRSVFR